MTRSTVLACGFVCFTIVSLTSCGIIKLRTAPIDIEVNSSESVNLPKVGEERTPSLPYLQRTRRPANAPWLLDPVDVQIRNLDAQTALNLVSRSQPIRFDLSLGQIPIISYRSKPDSIVRDALEAVSRDANWSWTLDDDRLVVRDIDTRTFPILAQPGEVRGSLSVNSLDSAGSRFIDGESVVFSETDVYANELDGLVADLVAIDSNAGIPASYRVLPRVNALMVTARPRTLAMVGRIIDQYNERTAKLVRIYLTVYEVNSTSDTSVGAQLTAKHAGSDDSGDFNLRREPTTSHNHFNVRFTNPVSPWVGSDLLLSWLKRDGDATINLQDQIDVRNNRIASSSSTRTYQYISSITREADNFGRVRTEVDRSQLRTGWAITVQPTIGMDTVTVRLSMARRDLVEERPFEFGDSSGTNFVTDDQNRSMSVTLTDGESRLITLLTASDERRKRNRFGTLTTSRSRESIETESLILMRVDLI